MMAPPVEPAATPAPGPSLRDIHLPPEPSWWPPALGWWMLAGLFLLSCIAAIWLWRKYRREHQQRRQVLLEVDRLVTQHRRDGDQVALASGLHRLLRRVARKHDALAAQQRGAAWRQTLARMPVDAITLDRLLALDQQIYRPPSSFDHVAAVTAVRQWLRLALKPATWKRNAREHAHA
jgi:hypothetical protein